MTGADLVEMLEALCVANPKISKRKLGRLLYGGRKGLYELRKVQKPRQHVVDRILAAIENPPESVLKLKMGRKPSGKYPPRKRRLSWESKAQYAARKFNENRRRQTEKARKRIELGLSPDTAGASLKLTQLALQATLDDEKRRNDPLEQAKTILRRNRMVVYSAVINGGPADKFIVSGRGSELVDAKVIFELAERLAA